MLEVQAAPPAVNDLPTGGQVIAGKGVISQVNNQLTIKQNSNRLITDWNTFNIGSQAEVNFQQPGRSSIALNRVKSQGASQLYGRLNANGQVFLINPSGVVFAPGAQIDVGGMVASTLNISNEDFLNGKMVFNNTGTAGDILNQSEINTLSGGYVALIAPRVQNEGSIKTPDGTVALASGNKVTLDFASDNLVNLTVDQGTIDALIENKSLIQAQNGVVIMTAKALDVVTRSVVNNTGMIEATGVINKGGRILLTADGGEVNISASLNVSSANNQGGEIRLIADTITLAENTQIKATGATGGGEVLIGGDWQGSGELQQATTVTMEQGAKIDASAIDKGDGGKVVLWSDVTKEESVTTIKGEIFAKGGEQVGDGGQIETSGHVIDTGHININAGVTDGKAGLWLIDPYNYTIDATAAANISSALDTTDVTVTTSSDNVSYGSSGNNADVGNINLTNSIVKTSSANTTTLTLKAHSRIETTGSSISSTGAPLNVVLWSDFDNSDSGGVSLGDITTNGGHFWAGGSNSVNGSSIWNGLTVGDGPSVGASGANTTALDWSGNITTSGGDVFMWAGQGSYAGADSLALLQTGTINSGSGDILLRVDKINMRGFDANIISTGHLIIEPNGTSFVQNTRFGSDWDFGSSLSSLTLGKLENTSGLFIENSLDTSGNNGEINLYGGLLALDVHNLTAGSGNITLTTTSPTWNSSLWDTTGDFTIQPHVADTTFLLTKTGNFRFPNTLSSLTIGREGNYNNDVYVKDQSILGPINVTDNVNLYGKDIYLLQSTTTTSAGGDVLIKAGGNIIGGSTGDITTNGGDITLWSDSDTSGLGYINLLFTTLDSRTSTDRVASTHTSGGGDITLSGGTNLNTGFAQSTDFLSAIRVDNSPFYSGGGDILVRAHVDDSSDAISLSGSNINSGTGTIELYGEKNRSTVF